ncbi:ABC transporter permease [Vineibacter terrae]|uniref:ABC transporter permease n=1 Tax=Vineibacter terrae TaxID=2586908 RepID=UPI002E32C7F0|nr:ABC transporter permease [Vineibacter terrae]HEX2892235.1 ABC transporter permease [Vineibacter terrae]
MPTRISNLAQRIGHLVAVLLLVSVATFGMLELLPGNLAYSILGEGAQPEAIARVEKELGLDRPLPERFLGWLGNALTGDLGKSYATGETVGHAIAQRLPVSLQLMIAAQILALLLALPLGLWAGYREGGTIDRLISGSAFGILAVPHFVLGIVLILLLAVWLRWLPASGFVAFETDPIGNIRSMILPSLTLALVEAPVYLRLLRSDVASTLREEFVVVARAKGLSDWRILLTHALRPSSFSLVTVMGINIGHLIGGTVIIETLFALPGIGRLLIEAINTRDLMMVQGVVLFIAAAFVLVNLLVDTIYAVLDPRLRHGR